MIPLDRGVPVPTSKQMPKPRGTRVRPLLRAPTREAAQVSSFGRCDRYELRAARARSRYENTIAIRENTEMMVEMALTSGVMPRRRRLPDFERKPPDTPMAATQSQTRLRSFGTLL
jgi:hypothetical protein